MASLQAFLSSLLPRVRSRALIPFPFPFERLVRSLTNFGSKYMFFIQFRTTIKVNLEAKIMQSAYLCVIFHVKHKKLPVSRGFNLISNSS